MKVLDLRCVHEHAFEGWFGSEEDFCAQLERGLVQCPLCLSTEVRKALSAPRLNLRSGKVDEAPVPASQAGGLMPEARQQAGDGSALQVAWLHWAREVLARENGFAIDRRFGV